MVTRFAQSISTVVNNLHPFGQFLSHISATWNRLIKNNHFQLIIQLIANQICLIFVWVPIYRSKWKKLNKHLIIKKPSLTNRAVKLRIVTSWRILFFACLFFRKAQRAVMAMCEDGNILVICITLRSSRPKILG